MSSGAKETGINVSIKYDEMNRNGFENWLFSWSSLLLLAACSFLGNTSILPLKFKLPYLQLENA